MCEQSFPEVDVGISEYAGVHNGFFGIMKQRFSDFHVNEITASNEIIHLTSTDIGKFSELISAQEQLNRPPAVKKPQEISKEILEKLEVLSGKKSLLDVKMKVTIADEGPNILKCQSIEEDLSEVKIRVDDISKDSRKLIHHFVKENFSVLCSNTVDIGEEKFIRVVRKDSSNNKRVDGPLKTHTTFVLYKENRDQASSISRIASRLRLKASSFAFAGMKDKRAKTSQLVSCYNIPPENLVNASKPLIGVHVGNFTPFLMPQKLGQLRGNRFTLVLREVKGSDVEIKDSVNSLESNGFLNYFGLQRFGGGSVAATHNIGKAILTSNWRQAVKLIMTAHKSDDDDMKECRKVWHESKNANLALAKLKVFNRNSIEGCVLSALKHVECPLPASKENLSFALEKVPRTTRLLYVHAYQSFIWNTILSRRMNTFGLKVLVGDLVKLKTREKLNLGNNGVNDSKNNVLQTSTELVDPNTENEDAEPVYILKEEDVQHVDITDVVLPLPGHKVVYPSNPIGGWYEELLQNDDLSSKLLQHKIKTYSLTGAYRNLLVKPTDVAHEVCYYDDPTKPLVASDLERMQKIDISDNVLKCGKYKAVILSFNLPASTYATMALRELLKMGTSAEYQTSLNTSQPTTKDDEAKKRKNEEEENCSTNDKRLKINCDDS